MKHILALSILVLYSGATGYAQMRDYQLIEEIRVAEKDETAIPSMTKEQKNSRYIYSDDFGRVVQTVFKESSPQGKDIIYPKEYDEFGRIPKHYLPFTVNQSTGEYVEDYASLQATFYQQTNDKVVNTGYPFTPHIFDNDPLSNVVEIGSPGATWNPDAGGHTVTENIVLNDMNEVDHYELFDQGDGVNKGVRVYEKYDPHELIVRIIQDENGNAIKTYTDKNGRIVLKKVDLGTEWLSTGYVYDLQGRVRCILPPELMKQNLSTLLQTALDQWAFQMNYNEKGLLKARKEPGKGWIRYIYDKFDRLRLVQDANQRVNDRWFFVKYDRYNDIILNGIVTDGRDPAVIQNEMDLGSERFERPLATATHGYTAYLYPNHVAANVEVLNVSWFHHYNHSDLAAFTFNTAIHTKFSSRIRGKLTGMKTRILGENTFLSSVFFYDEKGRIIQKQSQTHIGEIDLYDYTYNFSNEITHVRHQTVTPASQTITEQQFMDYDHTGRVKNVSHQLGTGPKVLLSNLEYNELGQLTEKNLHSEDNGSTFLQSLDYRYNTRGQLTNINNADLSNDGILNDDANDIFGFEIRREAGLQLGGSPQYNSNISEIVWQSSRENQKRGYSFSYDKNNRLLAANYKAYDTDWLSSIHNNDYTVDNISYDANGNILSLNRRGLFAASTWDAIDQLSYEYLGNQVASVNDVIAGGLASEVDFRDHGSIGSASSPEYSYDANGNMISDDNAGITLSYSPMNLVDEIDFGNGKKLQYKYTAAGKKLRKIKIENGQPDIRTDYVSNFMYTNDALSMVTHGEGRILPSGIYEYFIKDHLDNVRVVFAKDANNEAEIVQEKHYYPFGMEMEGMSWYNGAKNLYQFNGTELQEEFNLNWNDYGFRMYNPTIARWHNVDPLASTNPSNSSYGFVLNNPVKYKDILGLTHHTDEDYDDYYDEDDYEQEHAEEGGEEEWELPEKYKNITTIPEVVVVVPRPIYIEDIWDDIFDRVEDIIEDEGFASVEEWLDKHVKVSYEGSGKITLGAQIKASYLRVIGYDLNLNNITLVGANTKKGLYWVGKNNEFETESGIGFKAKTLHGGGIDLGFTKTTITKEYNGTISEEYKVNNSAIVVKEQNDAITGERTTFIGLGTGFKAAFILGIEGDGQIGFETDLLNGLFDD